MSTLSLPGRYGADAIPPSKTRVGKLTLWPLVAATFFMVSGGTYGTEDIVHGAGYAMAIIVLMVTPLMWSLPTALMVGELSSTLPVEGGFYAWVRRAMGDFWGFQEAWLSLVGSIFDMAIYPTLFVAYLARVFPWFDGGHRGIVIGLAMITVCTLMNIAGIRVVGMTSLWLFILLSAPFAILVLLAPLKAGALATAVTTPTTSSVGLMGGIVIAMWNYMGWDSASTIAGEVERPQRTYPRAMILAVGVVSLTYLLPVAAAWLTGLKASAFETGSWADFGAMIGGQPLRLAVVAGGMMSAFGMFNALVLSYSRLPLAMAQDGMLPKVFCRLNRRTGTPWVAILTCAAGWACCLGLGFSRLVTLDILLAGTSVVLEFAALVALRILEPALPRPFRVPGGMWGAWLIGVSPLLLLGFSVIRGEKEQILGISSFTFGLILMAAGVAAYALQAALRRKSRLRSVAAEVNPAEAPVGDASPSPPASDVQAE